MDLRTSRVLVVGAGLIGTSIALALTDAGLTVFLRDRDPEHARAAQQLGAGSVGSPDRVDIVVVAVPPDSLGAVIAQALREWPTAVVTDAGSVKHQPLVEVGRTVADISRYAGSHPMAGSELSGPEAATADLFAGRAWAITPHETTKPRAVELVRAVALACGAVPLTMSTQDHDAAVARVSHLPHLMSVLAAARLPAGPSSHLMLSGQGVRDVTRIAASDPELWHQIVTANAPALVDLLQAVRADLDQLLDALQAPAGPDPAGVLEVLARGRAGTALIPGKHGSDRQDVATVFVQVPDRPGELARLFTHAGESGVNVEDLRIDHDPGRQVGLVELVVARTQAQGLASALSGRGWLAHL